MMLLHWISEKVKAPNICQRFKLDSNMKPTIKKQGQYKIIQGVAFTSSVSICDPHSFHQFSHSHFCQVEKILRNSVKSLDWKVSSPSRFSFFHPSRFSRFSVFFSCHRTSPVAETKSSVHQCKLYFFPSLIYL